VTLAAAGAAEPREPQLVRSAAEAITIRQIKNLFISITGFIEARLGIIIEKRLNFFPDFFHIKQQLSMGTGLAIE
jgi:hypothetical protein